MDLHGGSVNVRFERFKRIWEVRNLVGHRGLRVGGECRRSRHQGCRTLVEPIPSGSNIRTIPYDDGNKGGRTKNVEENRQ